MGVLHPHSSNTALGSSVFIYHCGFNQAACSLVNPSLSNLHTFFSPGLFTAATNTSHPLDRVQGLHIVLQLQQLQLDYEPNSMGISRTSADPSSSDSWSPFFFFPSRLFSDLCVFWQAITAQWSRQAPAFLRGEACPPPPPHSPNPPPPPQHKTSRPWTSAHQHWEEAALPGFHEKQRNCRRRGVAEKKGG